MLKFLLALATTAVSIPLIASILGAPLGIPLFIWGIKPLKDCVTKRVTTDARKKEEPWMHGELN